MDPHTSQSNGVYVPAQHLNKRFRFRWSDGEHIIESDAILTTPEGWAARPESTSPLWTALSNGPLLLALRFPAGLPDAIPA